MQRNALFFGLILFFSSLSYGQATQVDINGVLDGAYERASEKFQKVVFKSLRQFSKDLDLGWLTIDFKLEMKRRFLGPVEEDLLVDEVYREAFSQKSNGAALLNKMTAEAERELKIKIRRKVRSWVFVTYRSIVTPELKTELASLKSLFDDHFEKGRGSLSAKIRRRYMISFRRRFDDVASFREAHPNYEKLAAGESWIGIPLDIPRYASYREMGKQLWKSIWRKTGSDLRTGEVFVLARTLHVSGDAKVSLGYGDFLGAQGYGRIGHAGSKYAVVISDDLHPNSVVSSHKVYWKGKHAANPLRAFSNYRIKVHAVGTNRQLVSLSSPSATELRFGIKLKGKLWKRSKVFFKNTEDRTWNNVVVATYAANPKGKDYDRLINYAFEGDFHKFDEGVKLARNESGNQVKVKSFELTRVAKQERSDLERNFEIWSLYDHRSLFQTNHTDFYRENTSGKRDYVLLVNRLKTSGGKRVRFKCDGSRTFVHDAKNPFPRSDFACSFENKNDHPKDKDWLQLEKWGSAIIVGNGPKERSARQELSEFTQNHVETDSELNGILEFRVEDFNPGSFSEFAKEFAEAPQGRQRENLIQKWIQGLESRLLSSGIYTMAEEKSRRSRLKKAARKAAFQAIRMYEDMNQLFHLDRRSIRYGNFRNETALYQDLRDQFIRDNQNRIGKIQSEIQGASQLQQSLDHVRASAQKMKKLLRERGNAVILDRQYRLLSDYQEEVQARRDQTKLSLGSASEEVKTLSLLDSAIEDLKAFVVRLQAFHAKEKGVAQDVYRSFSRISREKLKITARESRALRQEYQNKLASEATHPEFGRYRYKTLRNQYLALIIENEAKKLSQERLDSVVTMNELKDGTVEVSFSPVEVRERGTRIKEAVMRFCQIAQRQGELESVVYDSFGRRVTRPGYTCGDWANSKVALVKMKGVMKGASRQIARAIAQVSERVSEQLDDWENKSFEKLNRTVIRQMKNLGTRLNAMHLRVSRLENLKGELALRSEISQYKKGFSQSFRTWVMDRFKNRYDNWLETFARGIERNSRVRMGIDLIAEWFSSSFDLSPVFALGIHEMGSSFTSKIEIQGDLGQTEAERAKDTYRYDGIYRR